MTLQQTIQAGNSKVNELIAKLAGTSNQAIKTRESVFADLKRELEQYVDLEERHLVPILKKHPETKDIAPEASKANRELRQQLDELDRTPKNEEVFLDKIKTLQKSFQQHVRDERKEILPAIQKVLSREETQDLADQMEAQAAEAEQARRQQMEQEREQAKQAREREAEAERAAKETARTMRETTEQMARTGRHTAEAVADMTRSGAGIMSDTAQSGMEMAMRMTERSLDQFSRLIGLPDRETGGETARQATRNVQAVIDCSVVLANGFQNVSREWLEQTQDRFRQNADGFNAVLRARTPQDAIAAQSNLARRNLESLLEGSRRISELMVVMADQAMDKIRDKQAEGGGRRARP